MALRRFRRTVQWTEIGENLMTATMSEGASLLAAEVEHSTAARVARQVAASEEAVRHWSKGRRAPSGTARALLLVKFGIPTTAWDGPSAAPRRPHDAPELEAEGRCTPEEHARAFGPPPAAVLAKMVRVVRGVRAFYKAHPVYSGDLWEKVMPEIDPAGESIWVWPLELEGKGP